METSATAPLGPDVRVRFLNARHYYDAKGKYPVSVSQVSTDLVGTASQFNLTGTGFTLDVDFLDSNTPLSEIRQQSQDTPLAGYAPHCSLRYSMAVADRSFTLRKTLLRYRGLGRFNKDNPS
jgi:hypothetical protein